MSKEPVIAKVIVGLPAREVDRIFDYLVPAELSSTVTVGSVVVVPFGSTTQIGYVVGFSERSEMERLLPIKAVVNEHPAFSERMVELCRWVADYYLATMSESLKLALPPGQGRKILQSIKLLGDEGRTLTSRQRELVDTLKVLGNEASVDALKERCGAGAPSVIKRLCDMGIVERRYEVERPKVSEMIVRHAVLVSADAATEAVDGQLARAPKQRKVLELLILHRAAPVAQLLGEAHAPYSSLAALVDRGLVRIEERPIRREPELFFSHSDTAVDLTVEQQAALAAISASLESGSGDVFLLQGVTGSGKTEVYLRAIQEVLDAGKGAIVLVPEIALTAQAVARFKARFQANVAVLHSGLSAGERFDQWRGIQEGRYRVVVGARSAVFAPVTELGIIIVDEEHEASYKQGRNPRYNAREVAIQRASLEGAVVVLGSATPSLDTKYRSEIGIYRPLYLRKRVQERELPRIEIVDMRDEPFDKERPLLGRLLRSRLEETLDAGGKAILFLNRRGFSNFILCQDCGFVPHCRNCAVSLTFHSINNTLRCHHCNLASRAPTTCPKCGGHNIKFPGFGTQRVEAELHRLYPETPVVRMDADTTARKDAHQKRLATFKDETSAILLGTQMIAKGLDFPEVTLVGIVSADTSIHLPDFRAAEHTFQVLMQVAGRAGRGEQPGRVVVQTYVPDSYPLRAVLVGDYDEFYRTELSLRHELSYPPYSQIVRMLFSGQYPEAVVGLARRAARMIDAAGLGDALDVIGPSPAPILKIKREYRWHILLKVHSDLTVRRFLEDNFRRFVPEKYQKIVSLIVDVDPIWVL